MIHMRPYTSHEEANLIFLNNQGVEYTTVEITATGLKKSILDSTKPMRDFLVKHGIHDYSAQSQGTANKVLIETHILTDHENVKTQTSLYRPVTKKGDPRMWPRKIKKYTDANDIYAIAYSNDNKLYFLNITSLDFEALFNSVPTNPIQDAISTKLHKTGAVADELYSLLSSKKGEWLDSPYEGDTAVGYAVEKAVNVVPNSSKKPDYKGIEIKSSRKQSKRSGMFGKTPDRTLSKYDNHDIVNEFGYTEGKNGETYDHKVLEITLYCGYISRGLSLNVDLNADRLELIKASYDEFGNVRKEDVLAIWEIEVLRQALLNKHPETFWVSAES